MIYEYIGAGAFEIGVPARDLTQQEFDALDKEVQEKIIKNGLYKKGKPEKAATAQKAEE